MRQRHYMLLELVRSGLGIAIVPESIALEARSRRTRRGVAHADPDLTWVVRLVTETDAPAAVRLFSQMICDQATVSAVDRRSTATTWRRSRSRATGSARTGGSLK